MELLYVIVVVLIAGFLIQRGVKNETPSNSVSTTDFEDSDSQFGNIGMRDITGMSSDGKRGIRDVGDIGL